LEQKIFFLFFSQRRKAYKAKPGFSASLFENHNKEQTICIINVGNLASLRLCEKSLFFEEQ